LTFFWDQIGLYYTYSTVIVSFELSVIMNILRDYPGHALSLRYYIVGLLLIWSFIILIMLMLGVRNENQKTKELARHAAITSFNKDQSYRLWAASHGGVYVPVTEKTPRNPHLSHIVERDIETPSGKRLTLMNPAYMIRQLSETYDELYGVKGKITSLKLLRPENEPDKWERNTLMMFEQGVSEFIDFTEIESKPYLRYMSPMYIQQSCLKCHDHQNYKIGDVRGGVSVSIPMTPYFIGQNQKIIYLTISFLTMWILVVAIIGLGGRSLGKQIKERQIAQLDLQKSHDQLEIKVKERTSELLLINQSLEKEVAEKEKALRYLYEEQEKVQTLSGLIPICAHCKKIRDDQGFWDQLESYIGKHADVQFTHGICPKCAEKHFPYQFNKLSGEQYPPQAT
jgi:Protein of unknown function (DUF3365)